MKRKAEARSGVYIGDFKFAPKVPKDTDLRIRKYSRRNPAPGQPKDLYAVQSSVSVTSPPHALTAHRSERQGAG